MVAPVLMNAGDKAPRSKELVTYGTWGASSEKDRAAVRHLPTEEAIKRLEDGLPDRVQRRIAAFEKKHNRGQASTAAAWKHLDEMRGTRSAERAPHEGQAPGEPNGRVRPRARSPAAL
jgi:hypothetical protein